MSQKKTMEGKRFGHLEVLERTEKRQNGYCIWRCRCDCGNEIFASTKQLHMKSLTNCGCIPKDTARRGQIAEDLTGRHFGEWEVLNRGENQNGRVMWNCRCSCGSQHSISAHDLKTGKTKSCRSTVHERLYNRKDLTGKRFGRLVALYPTDRRNEKGNVYWHCRCDCGNETEVVEDSLVRHCCKSCGCLKKEVQENIKNTLHWCEGTCVEILEKRKYRKDNTSGFRGVYAVKNNKFRSYIGFKRKRFYIGTFDNFQEAVEARMAAEHLIHDGFIKAYKNWKKKVLKDPDWGAIHELIFDVNKINGEFKVTTNV